MVASLPSLPGVYWFLNENGSVLYVGKAKDLKKRVSSYTYIQRLQPKTKQLVLTAVQLKYQVLESELEALLTEAELIRTYLPQFNILLKDDKSPLYIHITDEIFPRVLTLRKQEMDKKKVSGTILGPFQSSYKVKEVLRIVRPIFPWCNAQRSATSTKACFYHHLHLCSGVCTHSISQEEYGQLIQNLILFLRGKTNEIKKQLTMQMKENATQQQFETAAVLRDQVQLITEVTSPQYKLKPDLLLNAHLATSTTENGIIQLTHYLHDYCGTPQEYPLHRIECYDVSNTQGTNAAVAQVVSIDGEPHSADYRVFNIKTLNTPNDYHMLQEALQRRQNHPEWGEPDLVIIDGGKGQLRAALQVWQWRSPVISIAKDPDRIIFPLTEWQRKQQGTAAKSIAYKILTLPPQSPALIIVQRLRDEAHRFSKKQHTSRAIRQMTESL